MRVALATSVEPKPWYEDIHLLQAALLRLGLTADSLAWDDPAVDWAGYDAVLIDSTWDYVARYDEFMAWCGQIDRVSMLQNDLSTVKSNSNKTYLIKLQDGGILTPQTRLLRQDTDRTALELLFGGPVVIKPTIGASGHQAHLFDTSAAALNSPQLQAILDQADVLIQDFIPQIRTSGEYSALFFNGALSHCVLKRPGAHDFRVQENYGGSATLADTPQRLPELYHQVMAVLDCDPLYCRLDFIAAPEPVVMEVEMIEPAKYFSLYPEGANILASAVLARLTH